MGQSPIPTTTTILTTTATTIPSTTTTTIPTTSITSTPVTKITPAASTTPKTFTTLTSSSTMTNAVEEDVEQLGLEFSRASTKAATVSNLPTVSRDDFLNFEKEVKVSLGMKKIRLLKLKTTDSVGATVHSSSISSDDFIDFDKDIVEKMGMKKIRLLKVITPKPTTISPVTVTTSSENPKTVKTQSSSKHVADDTIAISERLVTEKSISVEEDVSDSS